MPTGFKVFYLGTAGYHLHMLLYHGFIDSVRHDYIEMMFHHVLGMFLLLSVYLTGMYRVCLVVMFTHDLSDAFTQIVRCICETTWKKSMVFFGYCMLYSWIYLRCLVFPYFVYKSLWTNPDIFHGANLKMDKYIASLLTLLFVLNIYWGCLMVKVLIRYKKYGATSELNESDSVAQGKKIQ
jgi:ceramide synthetase